MQLFNFNIIAHLAKHNIMRLFVIQITLCILLLCTAINGASLSNQVLALKDKCNFPTSHGFLIIPSASTLTTCMLPTATFFLSHGATFYCPHTYDVKLLATFEEQDAQQQFCTSFFANKANGKSIKYETGPKLPTNGLPAVGSGQSTSFTSERIQYVHSFGINSSGDWNTTVIRNKNTTFHFSTLYFREFDIAQPKPHILTYLLYLLPGNQLFLSHYVSSAPCFSQLAYIKADVPLKYLNPNWPLHFYVSGRNDTFAGKLKEGETVTGHLVVTNSKTNLPETIAFSLSITTEVYSAIADGFVDYDLNCPFPPPYPQSRGLCPHTPIL